ncbi:hypothetical protein GOP47_0009394 [Adiantum capillus-veneris]|uniref:RRM domain-containing protein n=1 Tax=Adiantum capillus-veneris TaxID=13818 RepID=A0A9D4UXF3_ADICA|nr:hypothetical protein GOP47_0009394 [Adiantum capillus-veneris]
MAEEGAADATTVPRSDEEVRTLFISGLPNDIKEREIYNLFRSYPGYESCQLKYTGRGYQIVAFAVFNDQESALAAKAGLNGHKIDPDLGATLHIELAKSNSRGKRPHSDEHEGSEKKFRGSSGIDSIYSDAGLVHSVYDLHGYPPSQSSAMIGGYVLPDGVSGFMMGAGMPTPPARGSNAPCSTLFVANLGSTCTELEVTQAFSRFPGFRKVKMQSRGGLPVAFVEYQDTGSSTQALNQLQNIMLPSSVQGGIRLEFAKARMGQPGRERLQQQPYG